MDQEYVLCVQRIRFHVFSHIFEILKMNLYRILSEILNLFLLLNLHYSIVLSRLPYVAIFTVEWRKVIYTETLLCSLFFIKRWCWCWIETYNEFLDKGKYHDHHVLILWNFAVNLLFFAKKLPILEILQARLRTTFCHFRGERI